MKKFKELFGKGPINKLRRAQLVSKVEGSLKEVSRVAKAYNRLGPAPTVKNYVALGAMVFSNVMRYGDKPWDDQDFYPVHLGGFYKFIKTLCIKGDLVETFDLGAVKTHTIDFYGDTLVFSDKNEDSGECLLHFPKADREPAKVEEKLEVIYHKLGRLIWETYGASLEVSKDPKDSSLGVRPWKRQEIQGSNQTSGLIERLKKFRKAKESRSLLLYGPPGTGKSSMACAIMDELSGHTLFIDTSETSNLSTSHLSICLKLLCPYAIIIDDIDRVDDVSLLLSSIDRINDTTQIFIATANDRGSFDAAIIRAGRFDELVEVTQIITAKKLIPDLPEEYVKIVDLWPVSFIEELKRRIDALGTDNLGEEVERISARVSKNTVKIHRKGRD